jgi:phosphoserine phosphatase RsbU/P
MQVSSPRILVADDNDDNRYTLSLYLNLEGFKNVVTVEDGAEAITALQQSTFDLVLLDVMMPKLDGYGVLAWIKDQRRLRDLPIIMISAVAETQSVVRCIELGALDYLFKPFNPVLLRARLSASLEKKRLRDEINAHLSRLERELEAARRLHAGMVPHSFPTPSPLSPVDLFASITPAREVGGDLYDFFQVGTKLCFLVGDVSGKGMPAALFMARTKGLIRITTDLMRGADGVPASPADIISRVNQELCEDNDGMMFVTLFFAMLSPTTGSVTYCNAGHNAPYHIGADSLGAVETPKGIVLGVRPQATYEIGTLTLAPGESLYLFSDGVTEANDIQAGLFSEERLESVLRAAAGRSSREIVDAVTGALKSFVGTAEPSDDITMLAVRMLA